MTETGYDPAAAITEKLKDMTPDEAVKMVRELCAQLSADAESFHGNIWPDNVRLDWEGKAVLGEPSDDPPNRREAEQVEYLAPEFFWESAGSAAADVYSLGLLLFSACSGGYLPFQPKGGLMTVKDRSGALRKRMKGEPITAPSGVTPALAAVIRKALAYEPEDRYISAAELMRALGETDEALPAPPRTETEEPPLAQSAGPAPEQPESEAPEAEAETETAPVSEPVPDPEPKPEPVQESEPVTEQEPEPEKTLDDVLNEDLSFQELPAREPVEQTEAVPAAPIPAEPVKEQPKAAGNKSKKSRKAKKAEARRQAQTKKPAQSPVKVSEPLSPAPEPVPGPAPEPEPVPEQEPEPVPEPVKTLEKPTYTVQKDFEKKRDHRDYVPTANRKKRASPVIPILCVAAVAVIAAVVVLLQKGQTPAEPPVEAAEEPTVIYTVEPSEATPPPAPVEVTPSLDDDAEPEDAEPAPEEEAEPEEGASAGSPTIDGMDVEPADDTVRIADTGANLRRGPGTNYAVVATLPRGTELARTGTVNGWSQVQYIEGEYYVASNLVTVVDKPAEAEAAPGAAVETASEPTDSVGTLVVTKDVNIRSGPGTEYDKIGEAKAGTVLNAIGRSADGKWYLVSTSSGDGYVNRKLISVRDYAQVTERSGTLTVTGDVNLRSGPGTEYDKIGEAKVGDRLTLTGATDTGWYRISYNGKTAYLAGNYVTAAP